MIETNVDRSDQETMQATVGAFARVEVAAASAIRHRLDSIDGVETFDLDEPYKLGLIIEADDLDGAHALLTGLVRHTEGVLGVWPIYAHVDSDAHRQPGRIAH